MGFHAISTQTQRAEKAQIQSKKSQTDKEQSLIRYESFYMHNNERSLIRYDSFYMPNIDRPKLFDANLLHFHAVSSDVHRLMSRMFGAKRLHLR